jgi:hypothetical protein
MGLELGACARLAGTTALELGTRARDRPSMGLELRARCARNAVPDLTGADAGAMRGRGLELGTCARPRGTGDGGTNRGYGRGVRVEQRSRNAQRLALVSSVLTLVLVVTWWFYDSATHRERDAFWYVLYVPLSAYSAVRAWRCRNSFRS